MHRTAFIFALLVLAGCSRGAPEKLPSQMTDISGAMPRLNFHMIRAADGAAVTGNTYLYSTVILYFGYTHCPDVCPATLANLAAVLARAKDPAIKVLFVTVDPDRDTLPALKAYGAAFSPQVDGLRGTSDQLADLARRYRVAYSVKQGPPYEVMHSNAVFIFDWDGEARFVTTDTSNTAVIAKIVAQLKSDVAHHY